MNLKFCVYPNPCTLICNDLIGDNYIWIWLGVVLHDIRFFIVYFEQDWSRALLFTLCMHTSFTNKAVFCFLYAGFKFSALFEVLCSVKKFSAITLCM